MNHILDACALLAFLNDEEGAGKIEDLLDLSAVGDSSVYIITGAKGGTAVPD